MIRKHQELSAEVKDSSLVKCRFVALRKAIRFQASLDFAVTGMYRRRVYEHLNNESDRLTVFFSQNYTGIQSLKFNFTNYFLSTFESSQLISSIEVSLRINLESQSALKI